jgi:hypothetical protein
VKQLLRKWLEQRRRNKRFKHIRQQAEAIIAGLEKNKATEKAAK